MTFKTAALALVSAVCLSSLAVAQAPVVERTAVNNQNSTSEQSSAARNNYLEIQALREEVSALRGMIEELNYELRKVQRRQDEDYQDLDRRLATGGSAASIEPIAGGTSAPATTAPAPSSSAVPSDDGADQLYRNGFNALRDGDRVAAVSIFSELVENYPGSAREADSLYWLGETHWLNTEIEKSRQSFTRLIDAYPGYRKASDAKYRLGLIYAQLGDQEKAMEYMSTLAEGDNSQSEAAQTFMQEQGAP